MELTHRRRCNWCFTYFIVMNNTALAPSPLQQSNPSQVDEQVLDSVEQARDYTKLQQDLWESVALVCVTWDLLHVWHIDYIHEIRRRLQDAFGDNVRLIVWVEADEVSKKRKNKTPIYSQEERRIMFENIKGVDHAFISFSDQSWEVPETRPYWSTIYISPNVLVSHEEYYTDPEVIKHTVNKCRQHGMEFLLIEEDKRPTVSYRQQFNRSTTNTIKAILQQHW